MAEQVAEVAPGLFRLPLPLDIQGIPTLSAYLLRDDAGDTLVDCGIATGPGDDACGELDAALRTCGTSVEGVARLVVTHAHIDHFGLAGEVVRRSGGDLLMHRRTDLDLAKYADPDEAVDRRELMLADHGLFGPELTASATGLREWMPVMPSVGQPTVLLDGGERILAGDRSWEVVPTPGHSPGHVCLWSASERILCSGDHLLQVASPPVTFERGFERDPMGSYLESLERVEQLDPALVLPGHGRPFADGARRARTIARGKRRRLGDVLELVEGAARTVTELTDQLHPGTLTGSQRHFVMAELLADLAYHEARGTLQRNRRSDGVFVWSAGS
jgi:glyoxylase-like metal-dependent hydrolase (beta-lactamase superfamily II)